MRFSACFGHTSCSKNGKMQKREDFFFRNIVGSLAGPDPDSPDQTVAVNKRSLLDILRFFPGLSPPLVCKNTGPLGYSKVPKPLQNQN